VVEKENNNIIIGCKNGDRKSQEALYKNYYRAMMTICLRYTKNENDAVEVLNNGFLKIFRNIKKFNSAQAALYTWIRAIIINCCLDFIRNNQKFSTHDELSAAEDVHIASEAVANISAAELITLVRKLPPATQAVFNLYVVEGYNHKEIGKLLNISDGTSKWHLSEAKKTLQKMISAEKINT
jgi:RNA polymerase sigma factor (sigma-70 family)